MGITIEPKPGTYALILSCGTNARIQIGHRGTLQLQAGYYVYLGSALAAGGLRVAQETLFRTGHQSPQMSIPTPPTAGTSYHMANSGFCWL